MTVPITEQHSQERIDLLCNAKSHGHIFHVTGGEACNSEDALLALEKKDRESKLKVLTKKKKEAQRFAELEMQAKSILVRTKFTGKDLTVLLKWYGVKGADAMKADKSREEWNKILRSKKDPPLREKWTDADEDELLEASKPLLCEIRHWADIIRTLSGNLRVECCLICQRRIGTR